MKRYIEQYITIDEIVNYQGKLAFIVNNSPFKVSDEKCFSDIGFIGKYKIVDVQYIYNSKFHITDLNYYEFNELNITSKKIKIKIDIKNRIKLNNLILFVKKFKSVFNDIYPFVKVSYFVGKEESYIVLSNTEKNITKKDLMVFLNKKLLSYINFYFNITSVIDINGKTLIFFKLFDELTEIENNENYGIFSKYNFLKIMDSWYYDVVSNINFVYYIIGKFNYYILFNIKDKAKIKELEKNNNKKNKLLFDDEVPNTSFSMKKYNNFEKGLEDYLKFVALIIKN